MLGLTFIAKYWRWIASAGVLLTFICSVYYAGIDDERRENLYRQNQQHEKINAADETSAKARVNDAVKIEKQKQELENAISENPDATRSAVGCTILRQQGRDTTDIPACR